MRYASTSRKEYLTSQSFTICYYPINKNITYPLMNKRIGEQLELLTLNKTIAPKGPPPLKKIEDMWTPYL